MAVGKKWQSALRQGSEVDDSLNLERSKQLSAIDKKLASAIRKGDAAELSCAIAEGARIEQPIRRDETTPSEDGVHARTPLSLAAFMG